MKFPLFVLALAVSFAVGRAADIPRALPPGEMPPDVRLGPLKELDGYFPFTPPDTRAAWGRRAEELRMRLRVSLGIWPEPARTPLNAVVHGRIEQADYTVEKVYFESMPGFFVTGSLYRPLIPGKHPAVLCPHGHWAEARWAVRTDAEMAKEWETGGEVLAEGGRSMFQSLGVQLARMGIVAFVVDMIGYCDAQQIDFDLAHKFAKQRPEMNTVENWGLFSPQAEAHAQSIMGLQTWNNIRALDFLTALPDVDPARLGCTGASGGGTQTILLAALDPRIAVACPAVMVSTAMQGGCTCENASLLRVGTGNVELAALFAPKPQGILTANDWTKEMETKGFPELQEIYESLGAKENVALWPLLQFGHNYNSPSRHHLYAWFNEHFHLGLPADALVEQEYPLLTKAELSVWDDRHPAPAGGVAFERQLLKWWADDARRQITGAGEASAEKINAAGWKAVIGEVGQVEGDPEQGRELTVEGGGESYQAHTGIFRTTDGRALPVLEISAKGETKREVLWLDERGKAGLFAADGTLRPEVCALLRDDAVVVGIDLFEQGEFRADGRPLTETRRSKNPREAACYTFGYNPAVCAQRIRDIGTALSFRLPADGAGHPPRTLVALDGTGPLAVVALAVLPGRIDSALIETRGFRFGEVLDLRSPNFLPAGAKYGDLPGALRLARKNVGRLVVLGESDGHGDLLDWFFRK